MIDSIPSLGIGTWEMGGRMERDPNYPTQQAVAALRHAIGLGITHIDTAELYGAGAAEEIVAQAIAGHPREKLYIASKVKPKNLRPADLRRSLEASLLRLGTDYLDLYYIHAPNHEIPIAETMAELGRAVDEKLIRAIGVSNFSVPTLKAAQAACPHPIAANQVHYNLIVREAEASGLLEYCQGQGIALVAWRPLHRNAAFTQPGTFPILDQIAQAHKATPAQVAVAWLLAQAGVGTLVKSANPRHIDEIAGAEKIRLTDAQVEELRRDFPGQLDVSDAISLR